MTGGEIISKSQPSILKIGRKHKQEEEEHLRRGMDDDCENGKFSQIVVNENNVVMG